MPSKTPKQQRFFYAVKKAKEDPSYGSKEVRKVANSMSDSDVDDFLKLKAELKIKKAVLGILKDCREPMYLEEGETDVISKEFSVEGKFEEYVKRYLGQRFSEKELEAVNTFQQVKPTKIESNLIRYETTDGFKNSNTTIIKKLREGSDFVYVAFSKTDHPKTPDDQQQDVGGVGGPGMGGSSPMFERIDGNKFKLNEQGPMDPTGATPPGGALPPIGSSPPVPLPPPTSTAPLPATQTKTPEQRKKEMGIDDIIIQKSTTFKDDIKGGAILAEFLKKLDL